MRGVGLLIALLVLISCSSGSSSKAAPAADPTTTTTSTTVAALTNAQEASKVAQYGPKLTGELATVKADCDQLAGTCDILGGITVQTMGLDAHTLIDLLKTGTPPAELSQLVNGTIAAATSVATDADQVFTNDSACKTAGTTCIGDLLGLFGDGGALVDVLNGWKPYGA